MLRIHTILLFIGLWSLSIAIAADDVFTSKSARDAKANYDKLTSDLRKIALDELQTLRESYIADLTAARKKALIANDLNEAQRIGSFAEKLAADKGRDEFSDPADAFKSRAANQAQEKFKKALAEIDQRQAAERAKLNEKYMADLTEARKQALADDNLDEAQRIVAAIKDLEVEAGNWLTLFRSDDPSIWNTAGHNGRNHFARPLDKVPLEQVKYLRITNTRTKAFVIIEMNKDRMTKESDDGRYGWVGTSQEGWSGRHLGIYDDKMIHHNKGDTCMRLESTCAAGWGFGHPVHSRGQAYCWAGKPTSKTVFEISVTAGPLMAGELMMLLKK